MVTYEHWNKAIISYFFEDHDDPDEIVFLQTNAETLSEIADAKLSGLNIVDAAASLTEVVREKVVFGNSVKLSPVNPPIPGNLWGEFSEREPPQIAFLALMVLAASMMETAEDVLHTNYYVPLNQLLFDEQRKGCPEGIHLWQIEKFWKHLQLWALDQHHVELYFTEGPQNQKYVWYPKSQCMISHHDRRSIYCFFHDHEFTRFSDISDNQLEKVFGTWLQSSNLAKIKRHFSNISYKQSILSQVRLLLEHWDGEIPPEPLRGERQTTSLIRVELRFDQFDNVEIRYWFPRRGRDEIECRTNPLGIKHLQTFNSEKWFRPVTDNKGTFWNLSYHLELQTGEIRSIIYFLNCSNIWVFRIDSECDNGWISQQYMQLYENHRIVFRKHLANQVIDCLRQTCEEKIEEPSPINIDGAENDWLYLQVKPTNLSRFSDSRFWRLSVVSSKRISLIDGLLTKDQYGRRAYLDICLPTVFVPQLGLSNQEPLRIDEQEFSLDKDRLVTLHNALGPGIYQLTYGGQTRELRIISPEHSLERCDQTLIVSISENQTSIPTYAMKKKSEILKESGIWLIGAKLFGNIPPPLSPIDDEFSKVPAHLISSVLKVAIDFKKGKTPVPEWFDEAIEYLDQNINLRALIEKKLNFYDKTVLSYMELRKQIGK